MRHNSWKWMVWGVVASAAVGVTGCGWLPQQAGNDSYHPGFTRSADVKLENGTIADNPTSIDPRTPEKEGTPNRSLMMDNGERALLEKRTGRAEELGTGGSGPSPLPGTSPYLNLGASGSVIDSTNQVPTSQSLPASSSEPRTNHPDVVFKR